jgi:signal transduction histidine kinase
MFFKTKDEKSRKMNGGSHGIGLSVCKSIARNLKGDLTLNEEFKNGCEFCLSLTLQKVLAPPVSLNFVKFCKGKDKVQSKVW